ncbi:MAG: hypothetical protein ACYDAY_11770 [Candidatus Dormibacteria bacterium]
MDSQFVAGLATGAALGLSVAAGCLVLGLRAAGRLAHQGTQEQVSVGELLGERRPALQSPSRPKRR